MPAAFFIHMTRHDRDSRHAAKQPYDLDIQRSMSQGKPL